MRRHQFPGWRVPRAHPVRGQARDDLEGWNPDQFPPNQNGECETRTITTPDEFQINTCHETQNIAKKQCYREANVTTYTEDVLSDKTSVHVIVNHNSPAWTLTINPKAGTVEVSGNDVYVGQTCGYECIDSGATEEVPGAERCAATHTASEAKRSACMAGRPQFGKRTRRVRFSS